MFKILEHLPYIRYLANCVAVHACLTLFILMESSVWFPTIHSEWLIVQIKGSQVRISKFRCVLSLTIVFMPPKELWEAYSNRTVRPCVRPSRFVSGAYFLYSLS